MRLRLLGLMGAVLAVGAGHSAAQTTPAGSQQTEVVLSDGHAGVYPDILRGRVTASGAVYEPERLIASHRYLPLGSVVRVINEDSGESVTVRIVDRGPYTGGRVMDLSEAAAREIGIRNGQDRYVRIVQDVDATVAARVAEREWNRGHTQGGGFTIQLGSYSSEAAAESARTRAEGAWVQPVDVDGQTFFRLNFGRYPTRDEAAADLERLEPRGYFGFVKSLAEGV